MGMAEEATLEGLFWMISVGIQPVSEWRVYKVKKDLAFRQVFV